MLKVLQETNTLAYLPGLSETKTRFLTLAPEVGGRPADDVGGVSVGILSKVAGVADVEGVVVVAGLVFPESETQEGHDDAGEQGHHGKRTFSTKIVS
jgi:hypothetical protein